MLHEGAGSDVRKNSEHRAAQIPTRKLSILDVTAHLEMMFKPRAVYKTLFVIVPLWLISMLVFHSVRPTLQDTVNSTFQRFGGDQK